MADLVEVFPRRPLALAKNPKRTRNRLLLLLTAALLALPSFYWGKQSWDKASLRQDLRARGVRAVEVSDSTGDCMSRRSRLSGSSEPISCEVSLTYTLRPEEGGAKREAILHLDGSMPIFTPAVIYDPADPSRAMLAPEMERELEWDELWGPVLLLLLPAIPLAIFLFTSRRGLAAAARNPEPAIAPIEKAVRHGAKLYVHARLPGAPKLFVGSFTAPEEPLLIRPPEGSPPDQQWVLALRDSKGRAHMLDHNLSWLELTEAERIALLSARG